MPDDAAPPLRTASTPHAQRIRMERELMRVSGQSRSALRKALAGFAEERLTADRVAALAGIPTQTSEPIVTTETQSFTPQPMTLSQSDTGGGGGSPNAPVTPLTPNKIGRFVIETEGAWGAETLEFYAVEP